MPKHPELRMVDHKEFAKERFHRHFNIPAKSHEITTHRWTSMGANILRQVLFIGSPNEIKVRKIHRLPVPGRMVRSTNAEHAVAERAGINELRHTGILPNVIVIPVNESVVLGNVAFEERLSTQEIANLYYMLQALGFLQILGDFVVNVPNKSYFRHKVSFAIRSKSISSS